MKSINLLRPRFPLPATGSLSDILDFAPAEYPPEAAEEPRERRPFLVRGSVILALLIGGVALVSAGVYYTLIRPVDFSGKPRPVSVEPPGKAAQKPMEERVALPETKKPPPSLTAQGPPRPTSPATTRLWKPPEAPLPAERPSARVPAAGPPPTEKSQEGKPASAAPGRVAAPKAAPVRTPPERPKAVPAERPSPPKAEAVPPPVQPGKTQVAKAPAPAPAGVRAPSPPKKVAVARAGLYAVQVGACRTARCVQNLSGQLRRLGLEPYTQKSGSGQLTLVRAGSYPTLEEAQAAARRLKQNGFEGPYPVKR
ncbi:MAG: SPOR domain-containing protein [Candidatus Tectomicrobia bacterium]|nr:SPOR domain-containing protein [Candidatus Tectomicrobia bacterium]